MLRLLLFSWQAYPEQGGAILQCQGCNCSNYFLFLNTRISGQEGEERQSSSSLQCQSFPGCRIVRNPTRPCSTLPRLTSSSLVSASISLASNSGFYHLDFIWWACYQWAWSSKTISWAQGQVLKNLLHSLNPSVILLSIMDEG